MPTAEINGTNLYYEIVGRGLQCIALHGGLGMDHTYFKKTFGPIEDVVQFVYVDQRGNGRSDRPAPETITLAQLASDVDALRAHLGSEKFALLGHSFGGFVALEYATTYPHRLTQLFLLDTSPGVFSPTPEELAERPDPATVSPEAVAATKRLFSTVPSSDAEYAASIRQAGRAYLRNPDTPAFSEAIADTIFDAQAMIHGFASFAQWSVVDKLGSIPCPTLVACGRYDLQTTPECSKRLADAIPSAELVWLEESGHFPWIEESEGFFRAVRDWLLRHTA